MNTYNGMNDNIKTTASALEDEQTIKFREEYLNNNPFNSDTIEFSTIKRNYKDRLENTILAIEKELSEKDTQVNKLRAEVRVLEETHSHMNELYNKVIALPISDSLT